MTESQIERRVERMIDSLDRQYLSSAMSEDAYRLRLKQIDQWAFEQGYSARMRDVGSIVA